MTILLNSTELEMIFLFIFKNNILKRKIKINMNLNEESLKLHEENRGKTEVVSKTEVRDEKN